MPAGRRHLVFGGSGQLGTALVELLAERDAEVVAPTRAETDLSREDPGSAIERVRPVAVLNASAYNDVNGAELEANRPLALRLNRDAPAEMALACARHDIPLVHVSTDYVFDGTGARPYRETDGVRPLQSYGRTKLEGERAVLEGWPDAIVARTSTVFGPNRRKGSNYVAAVVDQARQSARIEVVRAPVSSPTYAVDLAAGLLDLLDAGASGLVHVVNDGSCSRLELAAASIRAAGLDVTVGEREADSGGAARPAYSVLDTSRFAAITGRALRPWEEAVRDYVAGRCG